MSQRQSIKPRLLTRAEAAIYCGMTRPMFERECPVRPLAFNERLTLFDSVDLDAWIDRVKDPSVALTTTNWANRMDG